MIACSAPLDIPCLPTGRIGQILHFSNTGEIGHHPVSLQGPKIYFPKLMSPPFLPMIN